MQSHFFLLYMITFLPQVMNATVLCVLGEGNIREREKITEREKS